MGGVGGENLTQINANLRFLTNIHDSLRIARRFAKTNPPRASRLERIDRRLYHDVASFRPMAWVAEPGSAHERAGALAMAEDRQQSAEATRRSQSDRDGTRAAGDGDAGVVALDPTDNQQAGHVATQIEDIPAADGADVMETLTPERAADVAEYLDPETAAGILAKMDAPQAAQVIAGME